MDLQKKVDKLKVQYNTINGQLQSVRSDLSEILNLRDSALREFSIAKQAEKKSKKEQFELKIDIAADKAMYEILVDSIEILEGAISVAENKAKKAKDIAKETLREEMDEVNRELTEIRNAIDIESGELVALEEEVIEYREDYTKEMDEMDSAILAISADYINLQNKALKKSQSIDELDKEHADSIIVLHHAYDEYHRITEDTKRVHDSLSERENIIKEKERNG